MIGEFAARAICRQSFQSEPPKNKKERDRIDAYVEANWRAIHATLDRKHLDREEARRAVCEGRIAAIETYLEKHYSVLLDAIDQNEMPKHFIFVLAYMTMYGWEKDCPRKTKFLELDRAGNWHDAAVLLLPNNWRLVETEDSTATIVGFETTISWTGKSKDMSILRCALIASKWWELIE